MKKQLCMAMLLGMTFSLVACSNNEPEKTNVSTEVQISSVENATSSSKEIDNTVISSTEITGTIDTEAEGDIGAVLGETVDIGGVKYTITNIEFTDERNTEADSSPSNVIKIDYTVENGTDEEIPIGADFTVYDANGTQMESYPLDNTMGSLAPGKNLNGTDYWGLEEAGNVEILVMPINDFENDPEFYSIALKR